MSRDNLEEDLKGMISDSRKLFGDVEEMDKDELLEMLNNSGAPAEAVRQAACLVFENFVKECRLRGEYPPQRYIDIVTQLRPAENPSQYQDALTQQAKKWVAGLLGGPVAGPEASLQFAFHRRAELTDADRRILEEAEAEVSRKMKKQNE